ncbi:MAG: hypothetical protein M1826_006961 [Phylliscum demangeonii]|nr:MAG: hypothetical protein M1826_006961 [Phylliscum demangeonii]
MHLPTSSLSPIAIAIAGLVLVLPAASALPQSTSPHDDGSRQPAFWETWRARAVAGAAAAGLTGSALTAAAYNNHQHHVDRCLSNELHQRDYFIAAQAVLGDSWRHNAAMRDEAANAPPADATVDDILTKCRAKGEPVNMRKPANRAFLQAQTTHCEELRCNHMRALNPALYEECRRACGRRYAYTPPPPPPPAKRSGSGMSGRAEAEAERGVDRMPLVDEAVQGVERAARHLWPAWARAARAVEKEGGGAALLLREGAGRGE